MKAGFPQPRPSSTLASLSNSAEIWPTWGRCHTQIVCCLLLHERAAAGLEWQVAHDDIQDASR
jgi:hypothetical protein